MYKGQKSVRGGIEDFLCPFTDMYITQGPNESYSHKGIMAVDVRGAQAGVKYPYYAPATSKCIRTYPESGQVMWQTTGKVRCSNKYIGIVTYMTCHDDTMDAYPGLVVPQGNQLGNMGTKGNATGVHCHIEFSQSADTSWFRNSHGNYMFNKEVDPEDVWFMDNTNVLNGTGNWKYLKDVPVDEPKTEPPTSPPTSPPADEEKVKLEKQVAELEEQIKTLENRILEVTEERDMLKATYPKLIFECSKSGTHKIDLYKKEKLYINNI